eukprot:scaffold5502_cov390-Prasinococcus_capsulatus_cf.AAC.2
MGQRGLRVDGQEQAHAHDHRHCVGHLCFLSGRSRLRLHLRPRRHPQGTVALRTPAALLATSLGLRVPDGACASAIRRAPVENALLRSGCQLRRAVIAAGAPLGQGREQPGGWECSGV